MKLFPSHDQVGVSFSAFLASGERSWCGTAVVMFQRVVRGGDVGQLEED